MRSPASADSEVTIYLLRFSKELQADPYARIVCSEILPKCDKGIVGILARWYVLNGASLKSARQARGRAERSRLRKEGRNLDVSDPKLAELRIRISRTTEAFSNKRPGVAADHTWLYLVRAYMQFKSKVKLRPTDLAALVQAASTALGRQFYPDPNGISHNLRKFEQRNGVMCAQIDRNIQALSTWLEKPPAVPPSF